MSHHYSGPDLSLPHADARSNFTDLFVFPKAGDESKSILIMNFHPSVRSCWSCQTLNWDRRIFGCGAERWTARLEVGFRRTAARTLHRNPFLPGTKNLRISPESRQTTHASSPSSHIHRSMLAGRAGGSDAGRRDPTARRTALSARARSIEPDQRPGAYR